MFVDRCGGGGCQYGELTTCMKAGGEWGEENIGEDVGGKKYLTVEDVLRRSLLVLHVPH